ncbi:8435_t:CDS:2, partial [Entrophospora sp. SA101]
MNLTKRNGKKNKKEFYKIYEEQEGFDGVEEERGKFIVYTTEKKPTLGYTGGK